MNPFKCNIKKSAGFSFIELMVVIAIIGIISSVTIPNLLSTERRVKKVARELIGNMQKARGLAVRTNSDVAIVFDTTGPTLQYGICTGPGVDGIWSTFNNNDTVATIQFTDHGAGVEYNDLSGGGIPGLTYNFGVLTFNSSGTCSAGFVYITMGNSSYRIGTLSTGIIRIHRWDGGNYS